MVKQTDTEAVLRALRDVNESGECQPLIDYLNGERAAKSLSYEDWVLPLKLTGGKVCIRLEWDYGPTKWISRESDGRLYSRIDWFKDDSVEVDTDWLSQLIHHGQHELTPVLREDTPFAENE